MKIALGSTALGSFAALGILIANAQAGDSCEHAKAEHDKFWKEYDKDKSNVEPGPRTMPDDYGRRKRPTYVRAANREASTIRLTKRCGRYKQSAKLIRIARAANPRWRILR